LLILSLVVSTFEQLALFVQRDLRRFSLWHNAIHDVAPAPVTRPLHDCRRDASQRPRGAASPGGAPRPTLPPCGPQGRRVARQSSGCDRSLQPRAQFSALSATTKMTKS